MDLTYLIADDDGDLGVPVPLHTAVIDIRRANDGNAIINNHHFRMHIDLLADVFAFYSENEARHESVHVNKETYTLILIKVSGS